MNGNAERNERLYNPEQPGAGAVEFARAMLAGAVADDEETVHAIIEGRYLDGNDPRIKECRGCRYTYRDKTRPNNSKTCSRECKRVYDAERKVEKRAEEKAANPNRKYTKKERHYDVYNESLEYPFWNAIGKKSSDDVMDAVFHKRELPYDPAILELEDARIQTEERMGGRRKVTTEKEY